MNLVDRNTMITTEGGGEGDPHTTPSMEKRGKIQRFYLEPDNLTDEKKSKRHLSENLTKRQWNQVGEVWDRAQERKEKREWKGGKRKD